MQKRKQRTYKELLQLELEHRNHWLYPREWDAIAEVFPALTEDEAEIEYLFIRAEIKSRIEYDRRMYE